MNDIITMEQSSIIDALIASGKYSLYHPTSKGDLLLDYPELRKVKSFMDVSDAKKMLFVWFYANRCSRGVRELHDDKQRILYALRAAYGTRIPPEIQKSFLEHKWNKAVEAAIADMRALHPLPRMEAVLLAHKKMADVKKMLERPTSTTPNWEDDAKYFKSIKEGMDLMQNLQPLTEPAALGVVEKTDEQEEHEGAVIEWLQTQDISFL